METDRRKEATSSTVGQDNVPIFKNTETDANVWWMLADLQKYTCLNLFLTYPKPIVKKQTPGKMYDAFSVCGLVAFYKPNPEGPCFSIKAGKGAIELCSCIFCGTGYIMCRKEKDKCLFHKRYCSRDRSGTQ